MTNQEMLQIALQQSAYDSGCLATDFLNKENKVVISSKNENARKYLELPLLYGGILAARYGLFTIL